MMLIQDSLENEIKIKLNVRFGSTGRSPYHLVANLSLITNESLCKSSALLCSNPLNQFSLGLTTDRTTTSIL